MRLVAIVFGLSLAACTASVPTQTPITQRAADACDDLASLCTNTGTCSPQQAFCGAAAPQFLAAFFAEDTCKTSCSGATPCLRACKLARVSQIASLAPTVTTACSTLQNSCSASGQGCLGGEFYCPSFALAASSPCSTQLDQCKAACAPHDRTCLRNCRAAYRQCLAGGTTPDAGTMPDAPTAAPDAPSAGGTSPNYTYTTDIAPVMSGLCNGCHTGSSAPAGYQTDSYAGLFGNGSDGTPNIIAGDATSLFVQKIAGNHHNVLTLYPGFDKVSSTWVVADAAAK
ncbi:MAG: hypothetical protein ACM31C_21920 [Acidobacteriota bacterium]